jgi:hypothetical protein
MNFYDNKHNEDESGVAGRTLSGTKGSSVPSISLYDFVEELMQQQAPPPPKGKRRSSRT